MNNELSVSICVPAYNEGKNIENILQALVNQRTQHIHINKIVVVSSASTDETDSIVEHFTQEYSHIFLIRQPERKGKASAINAGLGIISDDVVVIESADTVPDPDCIEQLCIPFMKDKKLGMVGGAPHPINDKNTFLGYIIHSWWWFHRNIPRFGEIIAYRNILSHIDTTTAVDEAFIQAKMVKMNYKVRHIDSAIVRNKGAETLGDLIKQRRRVMNGHARLYDEEHVKINNMTRSSLHLLLFEYQLHSLKEACWLIGGILVEMFARVLGGYDYYIAKKNPFVWDIAKSTKDFAIELAEEGPEG
ncbi:MAG TPA: glycosyltransferase family 2 protein [Candidatus Saccharimonadales bacterium]|nr:glycosyltransferase family 2 protein [Candidatus Saccharimonadales bacterium]